MKKAFYKSIFLAIGLILGSVPFVSCEKDFLEEVNPNELSTDSFWKTVGDLELGINAVYNSFKDQGIYQVTSEINRSDLSWPGWGRPNTSNEYFLQTFTESSGAPNGKWQSLYKGVFRANQVIRAYERLTGTFEGEESQEIADLIYAEARFFRGLFYFYLNTSFNEGAVVLFDFIPQNDQEFKQPLSESEVIKAFYREDLEYARENLPPSYSPNLGRVTAGAATAVLGKSYLYDSDYTTAAEYFKDVIENPDYGYSLVSNLGDNFTSLNEFNQESILEISYTTQFKSEESVWSEEQVSNNLNYSFSPVGGWRSVYPACWLIMAYKEEQVDENDPDNYVTVVDEEGEPLTASNGEDSVVLRPYSHRTSQSIALVDDILPYYQATPAQAAPFNNGETAYWRKYTNWAIVESERDFNPAQRSGINMRLIRLADVYLMYAECLIKGGTDDAGVEEAMRYINRIRRRAKTVLLGQDGTGEYPANQHDGVTYNARTLMDHLMYVERPLELSAEGHAIRTIDLRRWGITKERFEELSVGLYNAEDHQFIDQKGNQATRWASSLIRVSTVDEAHNRYVDRSMPASNYIESAHAYWPIPNSELTTNNLINSNSDQ
ncbi:RagB/SusD family nutrient uptake outer membrane protein [Marinoscillum furvescens]|uniref:Putative outer membrane starch-binding protein n=1 Tax=Marinoscillum furvescens DSM 4134 TaxID=1122208 RepID=A0A3D9KZM3_MARFU|nr:RagB/SusD family nutrient uptake outer membrane protein [Marinoscillum furvescens]RED96018.1 putative outer membrane starch-binding protein [Marinoscillum furvescens DSM 4134]